MGDWLKKVLMKETMSKQCDIVTTWPEGQLKLYYPRATLFHPRGSFPCLVDRNCIDPTYLARMNWGRYMYPCPSQWVHLERCWHSRLHSSWLAVGRPCPPSALESPPPRKLVSSNTHSEISCHFVKSLEIPTDEPTVGSH